MSNFKNPILIVAICSTLISLFSAIRSHIASRNVKKYHEPVVKVDAHIEETYKKYRRSMGPSYAFIVKAKNIGIKPVIINHPLVLKAIGLFGRKLIEPKIIVNYERNVKELPHELTPESSVDFQISTIEVKDNLKELSGCFKVIWVVNDALDRKYESNKIKVKILKKKPYN